MLHLFMQLLRYVTGAWLAYLATLPFYTPLSYEHLAAIGFLLIISITLVDIRIELSEARHPTSWFKL